MADAELLILFPTLLIVFVIPAFVLFRYYLMTTIVDFLLFSLFFAMILLSTLFELSLQYNSGLLLFQLRMAIFNIAYLILLYHTVRMTSIKAKQLYLYIGVLWLIVLEILILMWQPMHQPSTQHILGLTQYPSASLTFPEGAGIAINNFVLLSSDYRTLVELFWIYVTVLFVVSYYQVTLIQPTRRTIVARRLWIVAFSLFLVYYVPRTFTLNYIQLPESIISLSILVIGIVAVFIPEVMLLSRTQILQVSNLMKLVETLDHAKPEDADPSPFLSYLSALPDILTQFEDQFQELIE